MAIPQEPVTIPLGVSLDQSSARLFRGPDALAVTVNGDTTHAGALHKARGFTRVTTSTTVMAETPEAVFVSVGTDHDELVLVGFTYVYSVVAPTASVDGGQLVRRGPSMIGNFKTGVVHVASLGLEP